MNLISLGFLLFMGAVIFLYFVVPRKVQWMVIFAANLFFYAYSGIGYILYMLLISLATFIGAIQLEKVTKQGKEKLKKATNDTEKKITEHLV